MQKNTLIIRTICSRTFSAFALFILSNYAISQTIYLTDHSENQNHTQDINWTNQQTNDCGPPDSAIEYFSCGSGPADPFPPCQTPPCPDHKNYAYISEKGIGHELLPSTQGPKIIGEFSSTDTSKYNLINHNDNVDFSGLLNQDTSHEDNCGPGEYLVLQNTSSGLMFICGGGAPDPISSTITITNLTKSHTYITPFAAMEFPPIDQSTLTPDNNTVSLAGYQNTEDDGNITLIGLGTGLGVSGLVGTEQGYNIDAIKKNKGK